MSGTNEKESLWTYIKRPSGYVAIVLGILALLGAVWGAFYSAQSSKLTVTEEQYDFFKINETTNADLDTHLEIFYNSQRVDNPHIIKVRMKNSGNMEISEDRFRSETFNIYVEDGVQIYDAYVYFGSTESIIDEFNNKIFVDENIVSLLPFLLNKGEEVTIYIITNNQTELNYKFRIVGISDEKSNTFLFSIIKNNTLQLKIGLPIIFFILSVIYIYIQKTMINIEESYIQEESLSNYTAEYYRKYYHHFRRVKCVLSTLQFVVLCAFIGIIFTDLVLNNLVYNNIIQYVFK